MKRTAFPTALASAVALLALVGSAQAQGIPTKLVVRVTAHDAKIIGSGVGGAKVTIRDADSGRVLAEGIQEGSTGDTRHIMVEPRVRGATVFDTEGAARFEAELTLEQPTLVEIAAEGPLGTPHAVQRASKTMLLVPGYDVVGEGVVLDLMGFTVVMATPGETVKAGEPFEVRAEVTMLCGCPHEPGGMWDADRIRVVARVVREGTEVLETDLAYAGVRNTFASTLTVDEPGPVQIQVLALDPDRANFGIVKRDATVVGSGATTGGHDGEDPRGGR